MVTTEQRILAVLAESERALTVREIGEKIGLRSPASVHVYVARMERDGLIRQERGFVIAR